MGTLMNTQCVSLLCLFLLYIACHGMASSLWPPVGNSLKMKSRTYQGNYVYKCNSTTWVTVSAFAMLVNISDFNIIIGNYSSVYDPPNPKFVGTWYLKNDDADTAESGTPINIVAGNQIASKSGLDSESITQVLVEASFHKGYGIGSQISYIQRMNTTGGLPPINNNNSSCSENSTVTVPFEAEFWFYTQDLIPPPVPAAIAVPPNHMMVEGFFCKGDIYYSFDGSQWTITQMHSKLYNVPGGDKVGSFYSNITPDDNGSSFTLETANPNGWTLIGKIVGSVTVGDGSIPWLLFNVTSRSGNVSLLGPFKYYQLVGTRKGIPPKDLKVTSWKVAFSAQIWIYK